MTKRIDLTGKRFGLLTAIKDTGLTKSRGKDGRQKTAIWEFQCACGNTITKEIRHVTAGKVTSCGCLQSCTARLRIVEGNVFGQEFLTEITKLRHMDRKSRNNTSGIRGVQWHKRTKKWISIITFQRKVYQLGFFTDIEDAAKIRKQAEERIFGGFLDWYDALKADSKKGSD